MRSTASGLGLAFLVVAVGLIDAGTSILYPNLLSQRNLIRLSSLLDHVDDALAAEDSECPGERTGVVVLQLRLYGGWGTLHGPHWEPLESIQEMQTGRVFLHGQTNQLHDSNGELDHPAEDVESPAAMFFGLWQGVHRHRGTH